MTTKITKSQLKEHIAKLVAEQVKSLSPEAQKALELSRQAKQNKDAQKKRAAAKNSMRGISVEGVEPIEEQFSRMPGDKLQSDEGDFFDSTDLHGDDGEFEGWQDPDQQDHFYPEGEFPNDEFEFDFAPADEIRLYDEVPGVTSSPEDFMDPYPEDEINIDWDDSKRMELEQTDNSVDDLEDERFDALKREMDYQAWLDAEKEEDDFQRSGGGRRADWEWQY